MEAFEKGLFELKEVVKYIRLFGVLEENFLALIFNNCKRTGLLYRNRYVETFLDTIGK